MADRDSREYPSRPLVGVGAVILAGGKVLLIRRRFEPLAGRWSIPGGTQEAGETLTDALAREVREETGLEVEVGPLLELFDRITRDDSGRVHFHFVLADYLCRPTGGTLAASSDVSEAIWADPSDLARFELTEKTEQVIRKALAHHAAHPM